VSRGFGRSPTDRIRVDHRIESAIAPSTATRALTKETAFAQITAL
jgi:hypothetical protein